MKFLIVFALAFTTVSAGDLYLRSIEVPVLENEGRITNGINAKPGQFNYQVGLSLTKRSYGTWCGGSLIGVNWVLTAGHCADGALTAVVYLGSTERLKAEITYNVSESDMLVHPGWSSSSKKNDISLIRIPTTTESGTIGIVRIPSNKNLKLSYIGRTVVVSGWGFTNDNREMAYSTILQYAILEVCPGSLCARIYPSYDKNDTRICVATPGGMSPCKADSGGPLVLHGQNLQIGLFSFGYYYGCTKERPVVFTRVSDYLDWIKLYTEIDY